MREREQLRILCVLHSPSNQVKLPLALKSARYKVVLALTADQAVAFCINNLVAAVVLDSEFVSEEAWSVVQTFKRLCPNVPILLFVEDSQDGTVPKDVDAIANTPERVLVELNRLFDPSIGPFECF